MAGNLQDGATQRDIDARLDGAELTRECPVCGRDLDAPEFVDRRKRKGQRRQYARRNGAVEVHFAQDRRGRNNGRRRNHGRRRARQD